MGSTKTGENSILLRGETIKCYQPTVLNAFISALKKPTVTIRNIGVPNIPRAYEIACREERLIAMEGVEPEPKTQGSVELRGSSTKDTQKQEQEEPQGLA